MFGKLYIFDGSSEEDRDQAELRFGEDEVTAIGATSKTHLLAELRGLVAAKAYFSRVLVQTHGSPGCIKFDGKSIYDTTLRDDFAGRGLHRLFPLYTRFYFDGCNVAEGSLGDGFLDMVGRVFLRNVGGEVSGWTSPGYGMTSVLAPVFLWGHTVHFSGELKKVFFGPGGVKQAPAPRAVPRSDPFDDRGRLEHGFKI